MMIFRLRSGTASDAFFARAVRHNSRSYIKVGDKSNIIPYSLPGGIYFVIPGIACQGYRNQVGFSNMTGFDLRSRHKPNSAYIRFHWQCRIAKFVELLPDYVLFNHARKIPYPALPYLRVG